VISNSLQWLMYVPPLHTALIMLWNCSACLVTQVIGKLPSWYNSSHPNSKQWCYWAIKSLFGIYYFLIKCYVVRFVNLIVHLIFYVAKICALNVNYRTNFILIQSKTMINQTSNRTNTRVKILKLQWKMKRTT
jgi:hypothetical protein